MSFLNLFTGQHRKSLITKRPGERKFGELVKSLPSHTSIYDQLKSLDVDYVILGISEDIGVQANLGIAGASVNWELFLKSFLNTQSNRFNKPEKVLILGELKFDEFQSIAAKLKPSKNSDLKKLRSLVSQIDAEVSALIYEIVKAGKKPIIIGGGHNNAYGNLKGASLALKKKLNAVNLDAHTDFRDLEGRHSGNGFTYALSEGFLDRYFIYGIHKNYTSEAVLEQLDINKKQIQYNCFEDIYIRKLKKEKQEIANALKFVGKSNFGIEIDLDAVQNIPSSAMTPSGISVNDLRRWLLKFSSHPKATYLHLCEGAPALGSKRNRNQIGKLLSYLVFDFINSHEG